jgi:hypothetical protein
MLHPITSILNWFMGQVGAYLGIMINKEWEWSPEIDKTFQHCYTHLEKLILNQQICGKRGIITQQLAARRVPESARAVISFNADLHYGEVGIPGKLLRVILVNKDKPNQDKEWEKILNKVTKGLYCIINRAPTLWWGGVVPSKIRIVSGSAIQLHPLMACSLNADADGDTCAVYIPKRIAVQNELKRNCYNNLKYTLEFGKWGKELAIEDDNNSFEDYFNTGTIDLAMKRKFKSATNGLSIGLDDMESIETADITKTCSKGKPIEFNRVNSFINGSNSEEYFDMYQSTVEDYSLIKAGTSFSGSLGSKIVNVIGPELGQYALEHLSQNILARKHGKNESDSILERAIEILQKEGSNIPKPNKVSAELTAIGFKKETADALQEVVEKDPELTLDEVIDKRFPEYQLTLPWGNYGNLINIMNKNSVTEATSVSEEFNMFL